MPLSRSRVVKIATPFCPLHANSFRLLLTSTELLFIPISHSHLWCFGFYFEAVGVPLVPLFASNFQLFLSAFSDECCFFFFWVGCIISPPSLSLSFLLCHFLPFFTLLPSMILSQLDTSKCLNSLSNTDFCIKVIYQGGPQQYMMAPGNMGWIAHVPCCFDVCAASVVDFMFIVYIDVFCAYSYAVMSS